jgi:hypothetical protein
MKWVSYGSRLWKMWCNQYPGIEFNQKIGNYIYKMWHIDPLPNNSCVNRRQYDSHW